MTEPLRAAAAFLGPWEFSATMLVLCLGAALLYLRGLRRAPRGSREPLARKIAFVAGWVLIYGVTQTRYDYLSQHMFFLHRVQHLVLHHVGPFLIALSQPLTALARGVPRSVVDGVLRPVWEARPTRFGYRLVQNAVVAPILFVGFIFFWLTPDVHFDAMLSARLYWVMNWSMLLDGLLFWGLMLDARSASEGALVGFGPRILILLAAIFPQLALGAYITLTSRDLYDVYAVCGRAWSLSPHADQVYGGLTTWIPAGMMHLAAVLILIGKWAQADRAPARGTST